MSEKNEAKCCDAVLRLLEANSGHRRSDVLVDTPERRDVDVRCKISDQKYALEHTLIEPYGQRLYDDRVLEEVLKPAVAMLQERTDLRAFDEGH